MNSNNLRENPVSQNFRDTQLLHRHGIPSTPRELAELTRGTERDLSGLLVVKTSPDLENLSKRQHTRLIKYAGMSPLDGETPIGFALIFSDIAKFLRWLGKLGSTRAHSQK